MTYEQRVKLSSYISKLVSNEEFCFVHLERRMRQTKQYYFTKHRYYILPWRDSERPFNELHRVVRVALQNKKI